MFLVCLASRESTRILSHGKSETPLPPVMISQIHSLNATRKTLLRIMKDLSLYHLKFNFKFAILYT